MDDLDAGVGDEAVLLSKVSSVSLSKPMMNPASTSMPWA